MPRCIILTPLYAGEELPWIAPQPGDFLICADGGWARAQQFGLTPQLVVGAAGLVALGADDEEPARCLDLFGLGGDLLFVLLPDGPRCVDQLHLHHHRGCRRRGVSVRFTVLPEAAQDPSRVAQTL